MTKDSLSRQIKDYTKHRNGHNLVGIILVLIGFFWLAKKIGWIPAMAGGSVIFWPACTIALGVFIILGSRHKRKKQTE